MVLFQIACVSFEVLIWLAETAGTTTKSTQIYNIDNFFEISRHKSFKLKIDGSDHPKSFERKHHQFKRLPRPSSAVNLNTIAALLATNSLKVLTNYQHVDFQPTRFPVIVRAPHLVVQRVYRNVHQLIWIPKSDMLKCNSTCSDKNIACPITKYYAIRYDKTRKSAIDYCQRLRFFNFSSNTRPWKGLIKLDMHIPEYVIEAESLGLPAYTQDVVAAYRLPPLFSPNSLPIIDILITSDRQQIISNLSLHRYMVYTASVDDNGKDIVRPLLTQHIFFHLRISNIASVEIIKICDCASYIQRYAYDMNGFTNTATSVAHPKLHWLITGYSCAMDNAQSEIGKRIKTATNPDSRKLPIKYKPRYEFFNDRVYDAISIVVNELLINQSRIIRGDMPCARRPSFPEQDTWSQYDLTYFEYIRPKVKIYERKWAWNEPVENFIYTTRSHTTIRFVTCGRRGVEAFMFQEFVNVYDQFVWIALLVSISALSLILFLYRENQNLKIKSVMDFLNKLLRSGLPLIKGALEQGDPFAAYLLNVTKLRWIFSGYLLAILVLSSGYKNNNVYNMIMSRNPLLFENTNQLLAENYSIYTRTRELHVDEIFLARKRNYTRKPPKLAFSQAKHIFAPMLYIKLLEEQIRAKNLAYEIFKQLASWETILGRSTFYNKGSEKIRNISRLHENAIEILESAFEKFYPLLRANLVGNDVEILVAGIKNLFWKTEISVFFKELVACKRAAFLLPENLCNDFAKIAAIKNPDMVSVSTEVYKNITFAMRITNHVDYYFLRRMAYLMESGIVDWLPGVVRILKPYSSGKNEIPHAATMAGNILMIFIILFVGCGLAFLAYSTEICEVGLDLRLIPTIFKSFRLYCNKTAVKKIKNVKK